MMSPTAERTFHKLKRPEAPKPIPNLSQRISLRFDQCMKDYPLMEKVFKLSESSIGLDRKYLAVGILGTLIIYMVVGYFAPVLCNIIGVTYPVYKTMKTIEQPDPISDIRWLMYWVLFSCMNIAETIFGFILYLIPGYTLLKLVFLAWCMAPQSSNGCRYVYSQIVRPIFLRHEKSVDAALNDAACRVAKVGHDFTWTEITKKDN